jgi:hypothetical protein
VGEKLTPREVLLLVLLGVALLFAIAVDEPPGPEVVNEEQVTADVLSVGNEQIVVVHDGMPLRIPTTETNLALAADGTLEVCLLTLTTGETTLRQYC